MCMHSHFHPLLGIDLKWWLHECTTADHVIFLWDEDFRERKRREKGLHRPQAGNVKLWTIICWAKYNACQMNWSSTSKTQQHPDQNATEKSSVWICARASVCACMLLSLSFSLPLFHPLTHMYTQTQMGDQITTNPTVWKSRKKREARGKRNHQHCRLCTLTCNPQVSN